MSYSKAAINVLIPIFLCLPATCLAQQSSVAALKQQVYHFDAGSGSSAPGYITLDLGDLYNKEKGYGWITPPAAGFSRASLARFRDEVLRDGVSGKSIGFRADVPAGTWWISLWMEAGLEDTNTARLSINNQSVPLNWNKFDPPAEPRLNIQKPYRMLHKPVDVGSDGLQFNLEGQADSVRVLGFILYPEPAQPIQHAPLLARLKDAGTYTSMLYDPQQHAGSVFETLSTATNVLEEIRTELSDAPGDDLFSVYWRDQLDILIRGERLLAMRGWDWANDATGHSLFERIHQAIMILDGILDRPDAADFPLYERALFSRGRLLYWLKVEGSEPREIAGVRMPDLATLYRLHPADELLAMYNGKQIDLPDACDALDTHPDAPVWAVLQRETMCRLQDIAHWWVTEQQAPNGELGGKYGDDVEILRWWPALIMSGDTLTLAGWKSLADGVWHSGRLRDGYAKNVSDVEHASEFVSDTAPVMAMFTDDPLYTDRLRPSARHFEELWTGVTPAGHRYFKSAWFSSSEIDADPPKNRDVEYNTRATKAIRYLAWKTGDPHITGLMTEWSSAWLAAAMRTDKGKPLGIIPASIRYPDEAMNGDGDSWYEAGMYWSYFDWRGGSMMLDQLLFTYTTTQDEAFLEPMFAALSLIESRLKAPESNPAPGSPAWAADVLMGHSRFWTVVSQWRLYTGDTRFDDLLKEYGTPYLRYRLTGNEQSLTSGLQEILDKVRYNTPMLTYEAIHTDRIYVTDSGSGSSHLKAMLTGDGVIEDMSPYPAISWADTDPAFTALVTDAGRSHLEVKIYSFSENEDSIVARTWLLEPGKYRVTVRERGNLLDDQIFEVKKPGQRLRLSLPGSLPATISFDQMND